MGVLAVGQTIHVGVGSKTPPPTPAPRIPKLFQAFNLKPHASLCAHSALGHGAFAFITPRHNQKSSICLQLFGNAAVPT